jgi:hypothetical protein
MADEARGGTFWRIGLVISALYLEDGSCVAEVRAAQERQPGQPVLINAIMPCRP